MKTTAVRISNQRTIMTLVSREPGLSNADLARRSGLAPQTVSAVLVDLEDAGLVVRGDVRRGKRGQPATPVYLDPNGAFALGVEIGWSHIEIVLIKFGGETVARYWRDYAYPDAQIVFEEIGEKTRELLATLSAEHRQRVVGLGLAMPGGLGESSALIAPPPGLAEPWLDVDAETRAAEATGLDVQLFNDGNAACWAEFVALPMPRPTTFAYLLLDTFVAAGIVAENRLWEGVSGASANLGSMLVSDRSGKALFVHQIASLHALRGRLAAAGLELSVLADDALSDDAADVLDDWVEDASFAIAQTFLNTATVIDYEVAILEAVLPRPILDRLIEASKRHMAQVPSLGRGRPPLQAGHIGGSGAALGAAQLRLYRRFFSRETEHMNHYGAASAKIS